MQIITILFFKKNRKKVEPAGAELHSLKNSD